MAENVAETLRAHGIQPSAQRVAVAEYILYTEDHPSADQVWTRVRERFPMVSRATVYNTLKLFTDRGILRQFVLKEGYVVFDPKIERHHHFIDEDSGEIHDIPWDAVDVSGVEGLSDLEVSDYQVVMHGKRAPGRAGRGSGA